jgi:hypothetical protein
MPSINCTDFFGDAANFTALTAFCALTDIDVPENMPAATETKNKCFIRKLLV